MNSFRQNVGIFCALMSRDLYALKKRIPSLMIDTAVVLFLEVILFGSLMPKMGIDTSLVAPLFLGAILGQTFFRSTTKGYHTVSDIKHNRFIDYRITLPLSKRWLYAQEICFWIIEIMIAIAPFILLGIPALGSYFSVNFFALINTVAMLALSALLFTSISLACCYYYDYNYYMANIWPRRFGWLFCLSPMFFIWKKAYQFSPRVAQVVFLNPLTPCTESLRAALFQTDEYLSLWICIPMIALYTVFFLSVLAVGIKRRLDPV